MKKNRWLSLMLIICAIFGIWCFLPVQAAAETASYPVVITGQVSNVTSSYAIVDGEVTYDGGVPLTEKGIVWTETSVPMIERGDPRKSEGTDSGTFTSKITGLDPETTYSVRAYATNQSGKTAYGELRKLTTPKPLSVTTTPISSVAGNSAYSGGRVISDGGPELTARGVCWSVSPIPDTKEPFAFSHTTNGFKKGSFTSSITGLEPATTYYIRAYAVNIEAVAYGEERTFSTPGKPSVRTIDTNALNWTKASVIGEVTDDGGEPVVAKGVCWSTSEHPEIGDGSVCTTENTGTGTFESFIAGTVPGITYYTRAYATNSVGVSYGDDLAFKTPAMPGDVNGDGTVDLADALLTLKIIADLDTDEAMIHVDADVNGDKSVGMKEVLFILREILNTVKIKGHVIASGIRLPSAKIKVGRKVSDVYTDSQGNFTVYSSEADFTETASGSVIPVEVSAKGFATGYAKVVSFPGKSDYNVEISLLPISDEITADDNLAEGVDIEKDGETVGELRIPDSALPSGVYQLTGTVTYIDPTTQDIDAFPGGDFLAVQSSGNADEPVMLESMGVMDFNLKDQDDRPMTKLNGDADICMKIPEGLQASPGENIPLWWFNPDDGLWHEEGYGTVEIREERLWMCGKVNHFTWWNYDRPISEHSCFKFSVIHESGKSVPSFGWKAPGITYSGVSAQRPCKCGPNDPAPCPDKEEISSLTVKKSVNPEKPEQIRVYNKIGGVPYFLKDKGDGTFSLVTDIQQAAVFDTPAISGSCIRNQGVENCQFLKTEDGIIRVHGANYAPEALSLTVADQPNSWKTVVDAGQTVSLKARVFDIDGDDLSVSWSGTCGEISGKNPVEGEYVSSGSDFITASAELTASQKVGNCKIILSMKDSNGSTAESSAQARIHRDIYPPVVLLVKLVSGNIHVTFNEPVDPSTIDDKTFILSSGIKGAFSYDDRTAIFIPESSLEPGTTFTVTIKAGIKDFEGNSTVADYVWESSPYSKTDPVDVSLGNISDMIAGSHPGVVYAIDDEKNALYFIDTIGQHIFKKVELPHPEPIYMDYSAPDNKLYIVSYTNYKIITVYDINSSSFSEILFDQSEPTIVKHGYRIKVAPTIRRIYVYDNFDALLYIIHMDTGEVLSETLTGGLYFTVSIAIDETRKLLFLGDDTEVRRYSVSDDIPGFEQKITNSAGTVRLNILLSHDGERVIYGSSSDLYALDATNLENIMGKWENFSASSYVKFSPDGSLLYGVNTGSSETNDYLHIIDALTYKVIKKTEFPNASLPYTVFTPNSDGSVVVGYSRYGSDKGIYYITDVTP